AGRFTWPWARVSPSWAARATASSTGTASRNCGRAVASKSTAASCRNPANGYPEPVKAIVIGCGRVGSTVARQLLSEGWEVTAVDEKEDALARLGEGWPGGFVVGHGMDVDVLRAAGIEEADAVVVATDGDNTNLVIGQVAQKRFDN